MYFIIGILPGIYIPKLREIRSVRIVKAHDVLPKNSRISAIASTIRVIDSSFFKYITYITSYMLYKCASEKNNVLPEIHLVSIFSVKLLDFSKASELWTFVIFIDFLYLFSINFSNKYLLISSPFCTLGGPENTLLSLIKF